MAEEEEKKWKSRPESTIAINFAADLDSMFGLGAAAALHDLSQTVEEKKLNVNSREQTLQQLEARLRQTEERLAKVSRHSSPSRQDTTGEPQTPAEQGQAADAAATRTSPLAQKPAYPADRPPTSDERADTQTTMSKMPGAMPPETPQQNEYVMVDRNDGQGRRGYA